MVENTTSLNLRSVQKHTKEISKSAPFPSQHGIQIGGLWVFPVNKIIMVHHVRPYVICMYFGLSIEINMCKTLYSVQRL